MKKSLLNLNNFNKEGNKDVFRFYLLFKFGIIDLTTYQNKQIGHFMLIQTA